MVRATGDPAVIATVPGIHSLDGAARNSGAVSGLAVRRAKQEGSPKQIGSRMSRSRFNKSGSD
jgi:hypothetical protein